MQHKPLLVAAAASVCAAVALGIAAVGSSAPTGKVFVPTRELDRVRLGMTGAEVEAAWGRQHGVCRGCERRTWYFNTRPFEPQGTAVSFEDGRVVHAYTVWRPSGWRTPAGLSLGDQEGRVHDLYGPLREETCDGYVALVLANARVDSVFYVYRDSVWAFGLKAGRVSACI
jgi:hypothetical protein